MFSVTERWQGGEEKVIYFATSHSKPAGRITKPTISTTSWKRLPFLIWNCASWQQGRATVKSIAQMPAKWSSSSAYIAVELSLYRKATCSLSSKNLEIKCVSVHVLSSLLVCNNILLFGKGRCQGNAISVAGTDTRFRVTILQFKSLERSFCMRPSVWDREVALVA